jgi:uncharacterized protein
MQVTVESARTLYESAGGGHDFDHVLRVLALALHIGEREGADERIVRTAALLHDVAEAQDRNQHHLLGAARAREILAGADAGFVEAVAHCIEAHRFRHEPEPRTLDARVLSDADKLDAIGAIGIGRAFAYAGEHGTALWRQSLAEIEREDVDARRGPEELGEGYTPSHEFVFKLDRIPERLRTRVAREMAEERRRFMRLFFERLDREALGEA